MAVHPWLHHRVGKLVERVERRGPQGQAGTQQRLRLRDPHQAVLHHPDQPQFLGPFDHQDEPGQLRTALGPPDPATDDGVDRVAGAEQLDQLTGVDKLELAGRGQRAAGADPVGERTQLPDEPVVLRHRGKLVLRRE